MVAQADTRRPCLPVCASVFAARLPSSLTRFVSVAQTVLASTLLRGSAASRATSIDVVVVRTRARPFALPPGFV